MGSIIIVAVHVCFFSCCLRLLLVTYLSCCFCRPTPLTIAQLGKGATSETVNYIFTVGNVWWRWHIFVFLSVVVTVWGSVGKFVVYRRRIREVCIVCENVVKYIIFLALEC